MELVEDVMACNTFSRTVNNTWRERGERGEGGEGGRRKGRERGGREEIGEEEREKEDGYN